MIRKPATKGKEHVPSLCFQSHLDMVCTRESDSTFDFNTTGIQTRLVEDPEYGPSVMGTGTTLGADDGIGVAAALALLLEEKIEHGPIECLFTIDEEPGLLGIAKLPTDFIKSKYCVNLDAFDDKTITIGCAGGVVRTLTKKLQPAVSTISKIEGDYTQLSVRVLNCRSGHSGFDIHNGRANGIQALATVMYKASSGIGIYLNRLDGGTKVNVIPQDCVGDVWVQTKQLPEFETKLRDAFKILQADFAGRDDDIQLDIKTIGKSLPSTDSVLSERDSHELFALLMNVPHGVLRLSALFPGKVESSINFYRCTLSSNPLELNISFLYRSASQLQIESYKTQQEAYAVANGFICSECKSEYPAWVPVLNSQLLSATKRAYAAARQSKKVSDITQQEGDDFCADKLVVQHVGLEPCWMTKLFPGMEFVTIGAHISNCHSPTESLHINSVQPFYQTLLNILAAF
ncbi:putative Cytosol non-specific dipeptidase [Blattamonas nauphoetae]|uniref:Cytosol non-specific dipeptidase n=1 Tax=Blattamonas nauphoetae TaxID=2049346 RepID=A0ABQ9XUR5_9EUKA|nr:putative Cytosol non-specific dipeptidase [Blattamonas nauphoetae]